jgi:hypothetical protein
MRGRKDYRASYVASYTRQFLARQMREFRGDLSQTEFGGKIGKQQTIVSRLEDPNYGKWTLQTLLDVADKLDVAVMVRFVDFSTFLRQTNDRSQDVITPKPFDQQKVDDLVGELELGELPQALAAFYESSERLLKPGASSQQHFARALAAANENSIPKADASTAPMPPLPNAPGAA